MKLSQERYASDSLKKFGMYDFKSITTSIGSNIKISKEDEPKTEQEIQVMEDKPYGELVGDFIYLVNATRPDSSFTASVLSQYL